MYQFFVRDENIEAEHIYITGSDLNHIKNVLRMKPGETVRISSGSGEDFMCEIEGFSEDRVTLRITERDIPTTELNDKIYLFQGIPKGERFETVIEKAVELGVYEIVPVEMKYCVVKIDPSKKDKKTERWKAIAKAAAKQSKRSIIPEVTTPVSFAKAREMAENMDFVLVPYENEQGSAGRRKALEDLANLRKETTGRGLNIGVFIGPEGGFDTAEIDSIRENAYIVSLGSRILRTDTAAITTLSMLMLSLDNE